MKKYLALLAAATQATAQPSAVDLTREPWFPQIVAQQGASCAQQAGLYYLLSAEASRKEGRRTQLSPYFAYSVLSGSRQGRSHMTDGWVLGQEMGVPLLRDSPQFSSRLMSGFEKYTTALRWKVSSWDLLRATTPDEISSITRVIASGRLVGCDFQVKGTKIQKIPAGLPHAGESIIPSWTSVGTGHTMVYAGYDDSVGYDVNGDGLITTDRDITGDGQLTLHDHEKGAFLLVNPWGPRWGSRGKAWVLYRTHVVSRWPWARSVATVEIDLASPPRTMLRLSISASDRQNVRLKITDRAGRSVEPLIFGRTGRSPRHAQSVWDAFSFFSRSAKGYLSAGPLTNDKGQPVEMGFDLDALGDGPWSLSISPARGSLRATIAEASVVLLSRSGTPRRVVPFAGATGSLPPAGATYTTTSR